MARGKILGIEHVCLFIGNGLSLQYNSTEQRHVELHSAWQVMYMERAIVTHYLLRVGLLRVGPVMHDVDATAKRHHSDQIADGWIHINRQNPL
jgi:hypothetical protein